MRSGMGILRISSIVQPPRIQLRPAPIRPQHQSQPQHPTSEADTTTLRPGLIVVSLHPCATPPPHGLRSLPLTPPVTAVAMIGCCYNLMTERLGPATYKLPQLRPNHPRLEVTSTACDPD